jgi:hypothetical protein
MQNFDVKYLGVHIGKNASLKNGLNAMGGRKHSRKDGVQMSDKSVIFSEDEVRATLENRMAYFRRAMKTQPCPPSYIRNIACHELDGNEYGFFDDEQDYICPYGKPGDRLWVQEDWSTVNSSDGPGIAYKADGEFWQPEFDDMDYGAGPSYNYDKYPGEYVNWFEDLISGTEGHWETADSMLRWASRLEITNKEVSVEQTIEDGETKWFWVVKYEVER